MKKLILFFVLIGAFNGLFSLAQTTLLCSESITSQPHAEWWPIPGFIPADEGWVFTEWDLRTDFSIPDSLVPHMQRLVEALKTRGITVVGIPIPSRGMLHATHLDKSNPLAAAYSPEAATQNYLAAISQYEALGIVMVNPLPYLTGDTDSYSIVMVNPLPYLTGDTDSYSFKNDIH